MQQLGFLMICLAALNSAGCLRPSVLPPQSVGARSGWRNPGAVRVNPNPPIVTKPEPKGSNPWQPKVAERDWQFIVMHHTASTGGSIESIHEDHLKNRGWLGIGYHFVIGNGNGMGDGVVEPTFRWRQQIHGAHAGVENYNENGIGICLIGNFEDAPPTTAQLSAAKRLVQTLQHEYRIPRERVVGHGSIKSTKCPGRYFPMQQIAVSIDSLTQASSRPRSRLVAALGIQER